MSRPLTLPVFPAEEYLALERETDLRHEYVDGHVYAMAGESLEHSRICVNLAGELRARLKGRACEALSPNMKVVTSPPRLFAYPDVVVVCGAPHFHDARRDVLVNPTVICEVLSPSTEAYDRGEKFRRYREGVATLADYLLISQARPMIEHFSRQRSELSLDGTWQETKVEGLASVLHLASIDCHIPLAEIYDRVRFGEEGKR